MSVMRKQWTWIYMVAMLALSVGAIPGSVFASLRATTDCEMPCCVGEPTREPNDEVCAKGCSAEAAHSSNHALTAESTKSGCNCCDRHKPCY